MPKVSLVIPCHNRAEELRETLDAVRAQTHDDWEALVVDDRSGAEVGDCAASYGDARIHHVRLPDGKRGAPAARNHGLSLATGAYVIFLDSDDLIDADCLANRLAFLEPRLELDFAVWPCRMFAKRVGDLPLMWNELGRPEQEVGSDLDRYLRKDVVWQTASPMWRRAAAERIGGWDEACPSGQDWEFHVRAIALGLRYEKVADDAGADHSWRTAGDDRKSIGRDAGEDRRHCLAWAETIGRVADFLRDRDLLPPYRREQVAALFFNAARLIDDRVDGRVARGVWREAIKRRLVSRRRHLEGHVYLTIRRKSPELGCRMAHKLATTWPDDYFRPDTREFNVHRPVGAPPPRASFAIPARDCELWVEASVRTCLHQTLRDIEVVVVDDGSCDATGETLDRVERSDARLRVIRRPHCKPRGLVASLREAVAACRGEFILRMDADDITVHTRAERQLAAFDADPDLVLVGGAADYVDPYGQVLGSAETPLDHATLDAHHLSGRGGVILHPAAAFRRSAYDRVGGYRRRSETAEDLDLFLRLAEVGRVANLPEKVVSYRLHPDSVSHKRRHEQLARVVETVAEARRRRGMEPSPLETVAEWFPEPPEKQYETWGWMSLKRRHIPAARGYAARLLRIAPLSARSWRLAYCAARGH